VYPYFSRPLPRDKVEADQRAPDLPPHRAREEGEEGGRRRRRGAEGGAGLIERRATMDMISLLSLGKAPAREKVFPGEKEPPADFLFFFRLLGKKRRRSAKKEP